MLALQRYALGNFAGNLLNDALALQVLAQQFMPVLQLVCYASGPPRGLFSVQILGTCTVSAQMSHICRTVSCRYHSCLQSEVPVRRAQV